MFNFKEIQRQVHTYQQERGLTVFASSSFQTHSIPMLHIISRIDPSIPVYFLNTGYHFPETIEYRDQITELLGLNTIELRSCIPKSQQKDAQGRLLYTSDINYCCYLNKVQPMEPILQQQGVWISGVRADQNSHRANMQEEQKTPSGTLRYHPMLGWTSRMIHEYRQAFELPPHPLESKGYLSIGCEPCTQRFMDGYDERGGRWAGMNKTECGLHTELVK